MKDKKLHVCALLYDKVHPIAMANFNQLMAEIANNYKFRLSLISNTYSSKSKNLLAEIAAASDYDYVFFYDINLLPKFTDLERLLSHNKDVVSALFFDRYTVTPNYKLEQNGKWIRPNEIPMNKLIKVVSADLRCAVIKVELLKELIKKVGNGPIFDYIYVDDVNSLGEDDFFAGLLSNLGKELFVDTSVVVGQYGGLVGYKYHMTKIGAAARM